MPVMSALFVSFFLCSGSVFSSEIAESPDVRLLDVGHSFQGRHRVLVAASPGVNPVATLHWERALEDAGFDAWRMFFGASVDTPERLHRAILSMDEAWKNKTYSIVAHGYIGRFLVEANPSAQRMVLVGVPLGPQVTETRIELPADAEVVLDGLPWPKTLLGPLPHAELSRAIGEQYVYFASSSVAPDPNADVLLMSSGMDVVAPPECMRLPSVDWTDRTFFRVDSAGIRSSTHGDLLRHPVVERRMIRFLRTQ